MLRRRWCGGIGLWLVQVYNAARRKLEGSFQNKLMSGGADAELTALANRHGREEKAGSAIAPILAAASAAIGDAMLAHRQSEAEKPTSPSELAAIARVLMQAQPLDEADDATIDAATLAYTGTLRSR